MPIYPIICTVCEYQEEILAEIKDRNVLPSCKYCGSDMRRALELQTTVVRGDIEPGFDESLGMHVSSRRDLREKLAYSNAYCPDLPFNPEPSAGRLTSEERAVAEGRPVVEKKTIFDKRKEPGWGKENSRTGEDVISTEGQADYRSFINDIKSRNTR